MQGEAVRGSRSQFQAHTVTTNSRGLTGKTAGVGVQAQAVTPQSLSCDQKGTLALHLVRERSSDFRRHITEASRNVLIMLSVVD